jgi:hypothetical protein
MAEAISLDELVQRALADFGNLASNDYEAANRYFETYGVGNVLGGPNLPFERLLAYERLLTELARSDLHKYREVHKGTPFFIMSWIAFDLADFRRALFYMDAAISEDVRATPNDWLQLPASSFLILSTDTGLAGHRMIREIRGALTAQIDRFNKIPGAPKLTTDDFVARFLRALLVDKAKRAIVTTFYVFLLEFDQHLSQILLRSKEGGSTASFIAHLFTGGLLFESLLKHFYPTPAGAPPRKTLGDILRAADFRADFPFDVEASASSLAEIIASIHDESANACFSTAAKLRNTTGHNVVWDDAFSSTEPYATLFQHEVDAILYLIAKKC